MNKMFCNRCGNSLFFRKIIYGEIAIPVEVESLFEEEIREVQDLEHIEILNVDEEYYECQECVSQDIESERKEEDDEIF